MNLVQSGGTPPKFDARPRALFVVFENTTFDNVNKTYYKQRLIKNGMQHAKCQLARQAWVKRRNLAAEGFTTAAEDERRWL
ncbi:hypothetical protein J2T57_002904 [Natronocella acetinitrilica]|uniref:Uncharacterized protein n=1 Tax=Natronocella acetinitrilica TaxID=414046 RepID=A0AAE3G647_9GAMM|nr:hypothetical protein [Natronocella acetinitrilica]MCP1675749.1 hypothetical protein [Natronocella acetinitrilica]